ncbi:glycosyltransferase [Thermococcus sp.]|uniref:glycosyltransferase family 4 protein n=1 Tax=Thermococcus sp. TaxID=35749 RepID=UPI002602268E|nr:glycosyltransferase [Thermococcus sp.]
MGTSKCIIHVTEYMSPDINGKGTDVLNLARIIESILDPKENYIISGKWTPQEKILEEMNEFSIYRISFFQYISSILKLRVISMILLPLIPLILGVATIRFIKQLKLNEGCHEILVFGHHLWGGVAVAFASILTDTPAYLILYGTAGAYGVIFDRLETFFLNLLRRSFRKVFILDDGSNLLYKAISIFGPEVCIIFPQIIPEHAIESESDLRDSRDSQFKIMWLSGFNSAKSPTQAILAFSSFIDLIKKGKYPLNNIKLIMAGDGSLLSECQNLVMKLKLDRQVVFLGRLPPDEGMRYLIRSNLLLITSKSNSNFGRVALEALYLRVPIIATDTGRTKEFLTTHKHALICPNDPQSIGNCILEIFLNPKLARKLACNGRKLVSSKYTREIREEIFKKAFLANSNHE